MTEQRVEPSIVTADTVTKLGPEHRCQVLIGGSHGGVYAGYLAAKAGVRAVILNDAGVGLDQAGIGSLSYLDDMGLAAATVDHRTARIGDGQDMASRGKISHVNRVAAGHGCEAGMSTMSCAEAMRQAPPFDGDAPVYEEARFLFMDADDGPKVWGVDSASLVRPEDAGQIVVTASHGALLAGESGSAIRADVVACAFNDAGVGIDNVGTSRLPALDDRGIAAIAIDCMTARIGDARSAWNTGRVSHANTCASGAGVEVGMTVPEFAEIIIRRQKNESKKR